MNNKKSSVGPYLIIICLIYLSAFMIISPMRSMEAANKSLIICGKIVIPSLFPFIFCANMFIALGLAGILSKYISRLMYPIFGVSGAGGLALILGIISGYPIGAVCAATLYKTGECTKTESERLLAFCNNSGPMFIIGSIGVGMLKNYKIGLILYIIHIMSSLICGILFKNYGKINNTNKLPISRSECDMGNLSYDIANALNTSVDTILKICGYVIIFAVFTAVLPDTAYKKYIYAFIEITGGINELIASGINSFTLPLVSAFLSLSGLSVLAQVSSVIASSGLSIKPYVMGKSLQAIISFILTYIFFKLVPISVNVFSYNKEYNVFIFSAKELIFNSLILILVSIIILAIMMFISKFFNKTT